MNSVQLIGRWTKDPELRYTKSGQAVTRGTLAVDRPFAKEEQQQADFITVIMWGKTAEAVAQHTVKGQQIAAEGRIQVRQYTDQDGNKRWSSEVVANRLEFLAKPKNGGGDNSYGNDSYSDAPVDEDDLPF